MTNTINVPRELLENIVLCYNEGEFELGTLAAECHALLSAPSPAGVDGLDVSSSGWFSLVMNAAAELETASYSITDPDAKRVAQSGADYYRSKAKSAQVVCLSDAQAIIDGLRGEVDQWQQLCAEAQVQRDDYQSQRDQQAQRIGELERALLEVAASLAWNAHGECRAIHDGPIMPSKMAIDAAKAALSAGKDYAP